jgi:hypothetical protein
MSQFTFFVNTKKPNIFGVVMYTPGKEAGVVSENNLNESDIYIMYHDYIKQEMEHIKGEIAEDFFSCTSTEIRFLTAIEEQHLGLTQQRH